VLTGDTVLGRGTTVVAHPDGALGAYLSSLDRLHALASAHEIASIWPGHGPVIPDALPALDHYIAHRRERLDQIRGALVQLGAEATVAQVTDLVYADTDAAVRPAAEASVRAQLVYLRGRA
jgi:glyoxylase-like metal-dependent hydrolase (beta-lactamase superfamily II)